MAEPLPLLVLKDRATWAAGAIFVLVALSGYSVAIFSGWISPASWRGPGIGMAGTFLGIPLCLVSFWWLFKRTPRLLATRDGVCVRRYFTCAFVPWADIVAIEGRNPTLGLRLQSELKLVLRPGTLLRSPSWWLRMNDAVALLPDELIVLVEGTDTDLVDLTNNLRQLHARFGVPASADHFTELGGNAI